MDLFIWIGIVFAAYGRNYSSSNNDDLYDLDSSSDESIPETKIVPYRKSNVLFFKTDKDINLVFDKLMEGEIPKIHICYETSTYDGIAKIFLKEREGYTREGDKLHETIYLFMCQDHYRSDNSKGNIVWLDIDLNKKKNTRLIRVPMIYTTSRTQVFETETRFIDSNQPADMLFDVLIKTHFKKLPDADKKRCIAKLKKYGEGYSLEVEAPFTRTGHKFVYFENNYEKLPTTCKDLAIMLEDEKKFNTKTLLNYFKNTFKTVIMNDFLPLEKHRGEIINVDMDSTKRCWVVTRYAFVNDCINLIRFATDQNLTADIYEIYDIESTGQLDVVHAFLFNFDGCMHVEDSNVTVVTKGGAKIKYFDTFVVKDNLYVVIKKMDIIENRLESIIIKFDMGAFIYETAPIDVKWRRN